MTRHATNPHAPNPRSGSPYIIRTGERDFHFSSLEQALLTRDALLRIGADATLVVVTLESRAERVPLIA